MANHSQFLSCDWGTSSFRLRLVEGADLRVLREARTGDGVRSIFERGGDRGECFVEFLLGKLGEFEGGVGTPLIISGMASSTIGWRELEYARAPVGFEDLRVECLEWDGPEWLGATFLVSGVATDSEMIRGEETQAFGILAEAEMEKYWGGCLLVLPGTHSKHLSVREGRLVGIETFMTGEVFEAVSRHTVLQATVDLMAEPDLAAFREGVEKSATNARGLLNSLFQARTRCVLGKASKAGNGSYLSGLLIGAELASAVKIGGLPILIAAPGSLEPFYSEAMKVLAGGDVEWRCLPASVLDRATIRAHSLLLERHLL